MGAGAAGVLGPTRLDQCSFLSSCSGEFQQQQQQHPPQKQKSFMTFGFGASNGSTVTSVGGAADSPSRRESHVSVNVTPTSMHDQVSDTPEIRKYKKRFNSEVLCASLWGEDPFPSSLKLCSRFSDLKTKDWNSEKS
jgi:hypothetical protein